MIRAEEVSAVTRSFANALDCGDFEKVATMLASTCRYDLTKASFTSEGTLVGREAIVDSYRWHDARARNMFDRVEYSSIVEAVDGMTATRSSANHDADTA